jgi:SWI/SNF-related matrix-associated actin-dependent regulator 1 of chromatin subfamily A
MTKALFDYQEEGVAFMESVHGGILLADEQGLGKQQPWYSFVYTSEGPKFIQDIQVGDMAIGSDGQYTKVTGVFPQGCKPVYSIKTDDGCDIHAGPEHLWTVEYWRGGRNKVRVVKTTLELLSDLENTKKIYYLPMLTAPAQGIDKQDKNIPISPYLMGCLIANGGLGEKSIKMCVGAVDAGHILASLDALKACPGGNFEYKAYRYGNVVHMSYRVDLRDKIEELGINKKSADKFIPPMYLNAGIEDRIALLRGLMDCDGSVSKTGNRLTYHTIANKLAGDVRHLVQSLGGIASIGTYDRRHENKPIEYSVRIRLPEGIDPFSVPRKVERFQYSVRCKPTRRIVSVSLLPTLAESYCISVEAKDCLYATDEFVLTHNTAQVSTLAKRQALWPLLIVCPASLKGNWQKELKMWAGVDSYVVEGKSLATLPDDMPQAVIVNYDILYDQRPLLQQYQWKCIAFDEVHNLANRTSKRTKAAKALSRMTTKVIGMSGTPVMNRPADFWPILNIIRPELFPSFQAYAHRYCDPRKTHWGWEYKGAKNLEELHERVKPFMLRRLKENVLKLPSKTHVVVPLHLEDRSELDAAENDFIDWLSKNSRFGSVTSAQKAEAVTKLGCLLRLTSKLKCKSVVEWSRKFFRDHPDEKLILFAIHTNMVDVLKRRILPEGVVVIDGSTPSKKRQAIVDSFQNDPKTRLMVANIKAAGVGLTLTAASTVAYAELWWTPAVMAQGADRVHRIGQGSACNIYYLIVPETVEQRICTAIQNKQQVANSIVDGRQATALPVLDLLLSETGGLVNAKRPNKAKV